MKTIETVLAEANLSTEQVTQLVDLVEEAKASERASLRTVHIKEIREIEADRDATVGTLMRDLLEANAKTAVKCEEDEIEDKEVVEAALLAKVDKMVEESLEVHAPLLRQVRAYRQLKTIVEGITKIIGTPIASATATETVTEARMVKGAEVKLAVPRNHELAGVIGTVVDGTVVNGMVDVKFPGTKMPAASWNLADIRPAGNTTWATMMTESWMVDENMMLRERIDVLEQEAVVRKQLALFEANTVEMAETTREKVRSLMEASRPRSLEDYADMLAVAVNTVRPNRKETEHLNESKVNEARSPTTAKPAGPALTGPAFYARSL